MQLQKLLPLLLLASVATVSETYSETTDDDIQDGEVEPESSCSFTRCSFNATGSVLDCRRLRCTKFSFELSEPEPSELLTARRVLLAENRLGVMPSLEPFGSSLTSVDASSNEIDSIDDKAFFLADGLIELSLSDNLLTVEAFRKHPLALLGLSALERLDLSHNNIEDLSLPGMFSPVKTTLLELDLSSNGIRTVADDALTDIVSLELLDVSGNRIVELTRRNFLGLARLRRVNLADNRLTEFPADLFEDCHLLQTIDLRRNAVRSVADGAFRGLDSLEELLLDDNELPLGIPAALPPSLRRLSLDGSSSLSSVDMESLMFSDGLLGTLAPRLESISISRCPALARIGPHVFGQTKHLTVIKIAGNPRLATIDYRAFDGEDEQPVFGDGVPRVPVTLMNLSGNALAGLDSQLVNWTSVKSFDLSGNKWSCDCQLEWIRGISANIESLDTVVCYLPYHLRDQHLTSDAVNHTVFRCNVTFLYRFHVGIGLLTAATIVFVVASLLIVFRFRGTLAPRWFGAASRYTTLYSAGESTISLCPTDDDGQRSSRTASNDVDDDDDEEEAQFSVEEERRCRSDEGSEAVRRPLIVAGSANRGTVKYGPIKKKTTGAVDV